MVTTDLENNQPYPPLIRNDLLSDEYHEDM